MSNIHEIPQTNEGGHETLSLEAHFEQGLCPWCGKSVREGDATAHYGFHTEHERTWYREKHNIASEWELEEAFRQETPIIEHQKALHFYAAELGIPEDRLVQLLDVERHTIDEIRHILEEERRPKAA